MSVTPPFTPRSEEFAQEDAPLTQVQLVKSDFTVLSHWGISSLQPRASTSLWTGIWFQRSDFFKGNMGLILLNTAWWGSQRCGSLPPKLLLCAQMLQRDSEPACLIISLDQTMKLRQHTWASTWARWGDHISIRRNRKAHLLLINPRVGQRVWGCKYTLHRPVGRANNSLPQLSVSMAASLTQCLLDLHHEQCVRNARRILPFGGTLIERELDRCPTWCHYTEHLHASEADPLPDSLCVCWEWEFLTPEKPIFLEDRRLQIST